MEPDKQSKTQAEKTSDLFSNKRDLDFSLLFANNPIPMWLYDRDSLKFVEVNNAAVAVYGYSKDEFLSMQITDIRPSNEVPRLLEDIQLRRPRLQFSGEWQHKFKDGSIRIVEIASHTIELKGRKMALVISNDITKRKEAESRIKKINEELEMLVKERTSELLKANQDLRTEIENHRESERIILRLNEDLELNNTKLESANQELEAFSYSVSHDLHAPLRAIHGYAKILVTDYKSKLADEAKGMVDSIMANAKRMEQLIDDLLSFARVAKNDLIKTDIDMAALAQYSFDEITAGQIPFKGKFHVQPMPHAWADFNLLKLVFSNLLSNAIKYSGNTMNPSIESGSETANGELVYYIRDNGIGFDMKYYPKLFGVFQRLHTSEEFPGTGIGLVLVKRIINRHGGHIWAQATPGKGATFYFTLPGQYPLATIPTA
jgi:PAS domain S-box-containing protein